MSKGRDRLVAEAVADELAFAVRRAFIEAGELPEDVRVRLLDALSPELVKVGLGIAIHCYRAGRRHVEVGARPLFEDADDDAAAIVREAVH